MEGVLGPDVGDLVRRVHEEHGVVFSARPRLHPTGIRSSFRVRKRLEADFVVVGVGVRPLTVLAEQVGIAADRGVTVNEYFEMNSPGVYAAGYIARWPDRLTGRPIRIEHWVVAERQGQTPAPQHPRR